MQVRQAGYRGIKYYLDANSRIEEQSYYHISIEGMTAMSRLVTL